MSRETKMVEEGLAEKLIEKSKEYVNMAGPAMDRLAMLAESLKMENAREILRASLQGLRKPEFKLIVLGRFKNGKSTFLNILLGRLTRPLPELPKVKGGILPMDDLPTTPRLTTIRYGEQPSVTVVRKDGKEVRPEMKDLAWFLDLNNTGLKPTKEQNAAAFGDIQEFVLTYPFESGKAGIVLLDSPGTDEDEERSFIAQKALNECDAAIMLFRSDSLLAKSEREFVQDMMSRGLTSYFTVINRWGGRVVDERLRTYVWSRRVTELEGGPPYNGQDFTEHKIYFVDALDALEGKLEGDPDKLCASGYEQFERSLHEYFEKERRRVQVLRWVVPAEAQAGAIEAFINKTMGALKQEKAEFQKKYEEIRPKLEELAGRKDRLPKKFARFNDECHWAVMTDFTRLINNIRSDLPAVVQKHELKSLQHFGSVLWAAISRSKKEEVAKEAAEVAARYIQERVNAWARAEPPNPGVRQVIQPRLDNLIEDLKAEIKGIELGFDELHFNLTGYTPKQAGQKQDEGGSVWWDRVFPAAFGLAFGPDMAILGGANGWKGMGKGILVHIGVLGTIGAVVGAATGGVGLIPIAVGWVIAYIIRSVLLGSDLEKEVKEQTVQALVMGGVDPKTKKRYPGLEGEPERVEPEMRSAIKNMLQPFEDSMTTALNREIDQEIKIFKDMLRQNALDQELRVRLQEEYNKALAEVQSCRKALADAHRMAAATL